MSQLHLIPITILTFIRYLTLTFSFLFYKINPIMHLTKLYPNTDYPGFSNPLLYLLSDQVLRLVGKWTDARK